MNADEAFKSIAPYVDASRARIAELEAEVARLKKFQNTILNKDHIHRYTLGGVTGLEERTKSLANVCAEHNAEIICLQSHNKEAMKLLEAAIADLKIIQKRVQEITRTAPVGGEHKCVACNEKDYQYCGYGDCWAWQHADRYEALKAQSTTQEDTKNEQGRFTPNNL